MVVHSDTTDEATFEEESVSVDLSDVLNNDKDLGIDQSELQSHIETNRQG